MNINKKLKTALLPTIIAIAVVIGIFVGKYTKKSSFDSVELLERITTMQSMNPTSRLGQAISLIESKYVDSVDVDTLTEEYIGKMLKKLDPHSIFIPAKEFDESNEHLEGEFEGIGVVFNMATDTAIIQSVISGGPSEKVGILGGDRIIMVGDSIVAGRKFDQNNLVKMLKGKGGTTVTVKIERYGVDDLMSFDIVRGKIPIKSVDAYYMVNDSVGYIKLLQFSRTTHKEFVVAVEQMKKRGMKRLIFDLAGNPGGFLDQAILIANEFLPEGKLIVYTEGRTSRMAQQYSDGTGRFTNQKVVVMIDEGSASSSEIVAGALQDNDRGTLVGRRSFGKGLVQEQIRFNDGSAVNITIARYHTPTGRCIQRPYDKGYDEYYNDILNRYTHSELVNADSIVFDDSLKFTTPGGKTVYGGGGIMPDIFVPMDTTAISKNVRTLMLDNTLFYFTIQYSDKHRSELLAIKTLSELEKYYAEHEEELYNSFRSYTKGKKENTNFSAEDKDLILNYLRAYIGRNSGASDNGFYYYFNNIGNIYENALKEVIKD